MRFLSPSALAICLIGTAVIQGDVRAAAPADAGDEFTAAMSAAMERMDHGMMVPSSGDPDRDFAAMMIPHHQGAVDMAEIELRLGKNRRATDLTTAQRVTTTPRDALGSRAE